MKVSKLPARRISRVGIGRKSLTRQGASSEAQFFENSRRNSIRTVSLPRSKAREGMENVIKKNFDFRDKIVIEWRSRRNMPSIIQSRVGSKGLSGEFSLRKRKGGKDEEVKLLARCQKSRET